MAKVIDVRIDDHTKDVLNAMHSQVMTALKAIGQECERYAKEDCPVDTGRLRDSISNEVIGEENAVYVGTNVEYAARQEYGDYNHRVGKKHYLRDAAATHSDHYKAILEAALK